MNKKYNLKASNMKPTFVNDKTKEAYGFMYVAYKRLEEARKHIRKNKRNHIDEIMKSLARTMRKIEIIYGD